jgi:hypothetical protein
LAQNEEPAKRERSRRGEGRGEGRLAVARAAPYIVWGRRCATDARVRQSVPDAQNPRAGHIMTLLTTLLLIAMLATLGALVVGLAGFFQGGEFNRKYGNKLMQARVALQAIAVVLLLVILITNAG